MPTFLYLCGNQKCNDMNKFFILIVAFMGCWCVIEANAQVFESDTERATVERDYAEREQLMRRQLFNTELPGVLKDERDALLFLYAYMPLADLTDYSDEFYLRQVRATMTARSAMPWGERVPTLLFRHFVLPLRVNNENLDESRVVLFEMLKNRVKGLSMKEAILEVNHFCHEHVTYTPSDARTLSPLNTMKNALGRCGEESTFTVAALRAVGIPARQVYTPRWAHTDDNHAWVEAWADGEWYFLGACEPEAVLNLGWFNEPASRAMLMHTRAFGKYNGPEEVVLRTNNFTEINLTNNYANTARVDFRVVNDEGQPVSGARVEFKIYNYAEFYTAVTKYTDSDGHTFLTAGLGDMLVWASRNGQYGYRKASFGKDKLVEIRICTPQATTNTQRNFDIVPPAGKNNRPYVTEEQAEVNKRRLAREDSIRKAYETTFYSMEKQTADGELAELLMKARGNWQTIQDFYNAAADKQRALDILHTLNTKDLRDIDRDILDDVYSAESNCLELRVENEMFVQPSRRYIEHLFTEKEKRLLRKNPQQLWQWIDEHVRMNPDPQALRIAQTPAGALKWGMTDSRSREILFVSMARALGINAEKDPVTGEIVYEGQKNKTRKQETNATHQSAKLLLQFTPTPAVDNMKYYSHFTLSRIVDGRARLLTYDEGEVDMGGGVSWKSTFRNGVMLEPGRYLLVTGTRMSNGSVLATTEEFDLQAGKTTTLPLRLREATDEVNQIGTFNSESPIQLLSSKASICSQTGSGYFIVGCVQMGQEPTNHALHDICKVSQDINSWGRPLILLFENEQELELFSQEQFGEMPQNTLLAIDTEGTIAQQIAREMKLSDAQQKPIFIIADTTNRVVFCSQGYTIGLGEQLLKIIRKL